MIEPGELHRYFKVRHVATGLTCWIKAGDAPLRHHRPATASRPLPDGRRTANTSWLTRGRTHLGLPPRPSEVEPLPDGAGCTTLTTLPIRPGLSRCPTRARGGSTPTGRRSKRHERHRQPRFPRRRAGRRLDKHQRGSAGRGLRWLARMHADGMTDVELLDGSTGREGRWVFTFRHAVTGTTVELETHGIDSTEAYERQYIFTPKVYWNGSSTSEPELEHFAAPGFVAVRTFRQEDRRSDSFRCRGRGVAHHHGGVLERGGLGVCRGQAGPALAYAIDPVRVHDLRRAGHERLGLSGSVYDHWSGASPPPQAAVPGAQPARRCPG